MSGFGLKARLSGFKGAVQSIRHLPAAVQNRGVRIALSAGGGEFKRAMQARAPRETGLLKRSIGVKVGVPKDVRKAWVKVGAKRGFKQPVARNKKGKLKAVSKEVQKLLPESKYTKYRNPTRYLHLAEGGTKYAKALRFMSAATVVAQGRAKDKIVAKLRAVVLSYKGRK